MRAHGVPRGGRLKLKVQLFHRGATLFRDRAAVFARAATEAPFALVALTDPPKPLGGGWEHAPAMILEFDETVAPVVGAEIGLPREDFPKLGESEIYLCDLLGLRVEDAEGREAGLVTAIFDVAPNVGGSWNLQVLTPKGRPIDVPLAWVDWKLSDDTRLVVPEIWEWK